MAKKKIAIIGVGKIAIDQHLPVIDRSPDFEVAATVSNRMIRHRDLPVFHTPAEFYKAMPKVELVAIDRGPRRSGAIGQGRLREIPDALAGGRAQGEVALAARRGDIQRGAVHAGEVDLGDRVAGDGIGRAGVFPLRTRYRSDAHDRGARQGELHIGRLDRADVRLLLRDPAIVPSSTQRRAGHH